MELILRFSAIQFNKIKRMWVLHQDIPKSKQVKKIDQSKKDIHAYLIKKNSVCIKIMINFPVFYITMIKCLGNVICNPYAHFPWQWLLIPYNKNTCSVISIRENRKDIKYQEKSLCGCDPEKILWQQEPVKE